MPQASTLNWMMISNTTLMMMMMSSMAIWKSTESKSNKTMKKTNMKTIKWSW